MTIALIVWAAFVAFVYLFMWLDEAYYRYNLPETFQKIVDTFTEED